MSARLLRLDAAAHRVVDVLLPGYVGGTLDTDERALVVGTSDVFFVLFGPQEHHSGASATVDTFVRDHAHPIAVIPGPTRGRDATVYRFSS